MPVVTRDTLAPVGDSNKLAIFALTATGVFDTAVIVFERITSSALVGHPNKGNLTINLDIKQDDAAMLSFYNTYLSNVEVTATNVKYTDSSITTIVSGRDASNPFGVIWYGGSIGVDKKIVAGRFILSGDSGNADYAPDNYGAYPVTLQAIDGLTITVPSTKMDSTEITGADLTIGNTSFGCVKFYSTVA